MSQDQALDIHGKPYNRGLLVAVLLIGTFCTILNQTLLSTALPTLMSAFDISAADVQWLTTGFLLVNGIMIPVSAWMINKFTSRSLYLFSMGIFIVGTVACLVAPSFSVLLIGRLIQACGVGMSMPLLQTILLTIYPPEKRGAAMGMSGIVVALGPALGPTLSGYIIDNYSWRYLFGLMLPIAALVFILAIFLMKSVLKVSNPKIDVLSIITSTIGFGALLYGFSSVGNKGWGDAEVITFIVVGVVFIALFSIRQLRLETPFLELRVFKSGIFTIATILSGVTNMALIGAGMVVPLFLQNIHGQSAFESGLMLLPGALIMGAMMPVTGKLFDKYGARRLAVAGMFILTAATVPFMFLNADTPIPYFMVLYAVRMFGISMAMMPVTAAGMNSLPTHLMSHGTAVNNTFRQIAGSIGTAILISILTSVTKNNLPAKSVLEATPLAYKEQAVHATLTGYQAAFIVSVVFSVVGLLITFTLKAGNKVVVEKGEAKA